MRLSRSSAGLLAKFSDCRSAILPHPAFIGSAFLAVGFRSGFCGHYFKLLGVFHLPLIARLQRQRIEASCPIGSIFDGSDFWHATCSAPLKLFR
jgi:hypothetical protein